MAYSLGLTYDEREAAKMPLAMLLLAIARRAFRAYDGAMATPHNLDSLRHAFRAMLIAIADAQVFAYFGIWDSHDMRQAPICNVQMNRRYPRQVDVLIDPLLAWMLNH